MWIVNRKRLLTVDRLRRLNLIIFIHLLTIQLQYLKTKIIQQCKIVKRLKIIYIVELIYIVGNIIFFFYFK